MLQEHMVEIDSSPPPPLDDGGGVVLPPPPLARGLLLLLLMERDHPFIVLTETKFRQKQSFDSVGRIQIAQVAMNETFYSFLQEQ